MCSDKTGDVEQKVPLARKLNLETARIAWRDLQTFFANGSVVYVDASLDLLTVAEQLVADNSATVGTWMNQGLVGNVKDEQALDWFERDATMWSLVIKPWVLVQECQPQ